MKQSHILNGDALRERFPKTIEGELIVFRECLVDGPVKSKSSEDFWALRSEFLFNNYRVPIEEYMSQSVPELEKIKQIKEGAEINLWFEDDLFCQVNLWFVLNQLQKSGIENHIYLIRPDEFNRYGFAGMDQNSLYEIYTSAVLIEDIDELSSLWELYHLDKLNELKVLGKKLLTKYDFLLPAIEAHISRQDTDQGKGKPVQIINAIMEDLNTNEFGPVFMEFCKRAPIYGFGDLQVKRIFDEIVS